MKKIIIVSVLLSILLLATFYIRTVTALTIGNSYTDSAGITHYTFGDGTTATSYKDIIGHVNFNLSDGSTGYAYTDEIGHVQYYFNSNNSSTPVDTSPCSIYMKSYGGQQICADESNYQSLYNSALAGVPKVGTVYGERGSFCYPSCTTTLEDQEKMIMSGAYGSSLKICREQITSYQTQLNSYNQCIAKENQDRQTANQARLDYVTAKYKLTQSSVATPTPQDPGNFVQNATCVIKYRYARYNESLSRCICQDGYEMANNTCALKPTPTATPTPKLSNGFTNITTLVSPTPRPARNLLKPSTFNPWTPSSLPTTQTIYKLDQLKLTEPAVTKNIPWYKKIFNFFSFKFGI